MREDRLVEWSSATIFFAAFALRARAALRTRRPFDGLVALFCLFVAGEEISWGQRLIGFESPAFFLDHNRQEETTLHNFADVFGKPKWTLVAMLSGFGLVLPATAATSAGAHTLKRIGLTAPPPQLAWWFGACVALLLWYPLRFTGEWVELLASGMFLASSPSGLRAAAGALAVAAGGVLTALSEGGRELLAFAGSGVYVWGS